VTKTGVLSGEGGKVGTMIEGRALKPSDKIYDLLDVLGEDEFPAAVIQGVQGKTAGRERIYDLTDVVERRPRMALVDPGLHEEIMRRAAEIAERIAHEVIPAVAERVIREEIEKLKKMT